MKFDQKALQLLASSEDCDKQGCLWMQERYIWKSVFVQRWCRLKSNILIYFKAAAETSEPMGAVVLEGYVVERDYSCGQKHALRLASEKVGEEIFLAAHSEREANDWLSALRKASFEGLRALLTELRDRMLKLSGEDPVPSWYHLNLEDKDDGALVRSSTSPELALGDDEAGIVLELTIGCSSLTGPVANAVPSTYVMTEIMTPPQAFWVKHAQTEIVEESKDPQFFTTIVFRTGSVSLISRIRLVVFHQGSRNEDSNKLCALGEVCTTVGTVVTSQAPILILPLRPCSSDTGDEQFHSADGRVCLQRWKDDAPGRPLSLHPNMSVQRKSKEKLKTSSFRAEKASWLAVDNIMRATFRFPCRMPGKVIKAAELMGESIFTWTIPIQLLKLFIAEDRSLLLKLSELGSLTSTWQRRCENLKEELRSFILYYTETVSRLEGILDDQEMSFKSSAQKGERRLEFIATNLHIQRIKLELCNNSVMNTLTQQAELIATTPITPSSPSLRRFDSNASTSSDSPSVVRMSGENSELDSPAETPSASSASSAVRFRRKRGTFEIVTVGAPAAHSLKFKNGGLYRLLQSYGEAESGTDDLSASSRQRLYSNQKQIEELQAEFSLLLDKFYQHVQETDREKISQTMLNIEEKTKQLIQLCKGTAIQSAVYELSRVQASNGARSVSPVNDWVWDGHEFVRSSATFSDVSITCASVEQHCLSLTTKVEVLMEKKSNIDAHWREVLNDGVRFLSTALNSFFHQLQTALTFVMLHEYGEHPSAGWVAGVGGLKHRRDIAFSQALTSVITGFVSMFHVKRTHTSWGLQLLHVGLLVHWESLLSTSGDEQGMLEDTVVAMEDLRHVQLRLEPSLDSSEQVAPRISGCRGDICVVIPFQKSELTSLPAELRAGAPVKLWPVLFTQGVNELQLKAELLRDTGLQEQINHDNCSRLQQYFEHYHDVFALANSHQMQMNNYIQRSMENLRHATLNKTGRNIDVLLSSREICRHLNALRLTSCKSAKDRTAMSCTLEECEVMVHEYELAPDKFDNVLAILRSCGTRLMNTHKNIGERRYAFNQVQLQVMPKQLRPPEGTYGSSVT